MPENNNDNPDLLIGAERLKIHDSGNTIGDHNSETERLNEKLDSLSGFVGGIAHDLNNIVTAIQGNVGLAKMAPFPGQNIGAFLDEIEKSALRASQLAQQVLTFSKAGTLPSRRPVLIGNIVNEAASQALKGSKVRHSMSLGDGIWIANVDDGQINQVMYTLIKKVQKTMIDGGIVGIRLQNVGQEGFRPIGLVETPFIKISIKDSGEGSLKEAPELIFDPYSTSKSGGTGLGLVTAYSIVRKHEGTITVKSQIGGGTEYSIYLPALMEKPIDREMIPPAPLKVASRILVVEDEEQLRKIMRDILSRLGYEVVIADEGENGMKRFKEGLDQANPFDLAIIDLTLPGGLGEKDLLFCFQKMDPGIKAIITSGYSNDPEMADFKKYGFKGSLAKPYKLADLDRIVKQVLN